MPAGAVKADDYAFGEPSLAQAPVAASSEVFYAYNPAMAGLYA